MKRIMAAFAALFISAEAHALDVVWQTGALVKQPPLTFGIPAPYKYRCAPWEDCSNLAEINPDYWVSYINCWYQPAWYAPTLQQHIIGGSDPGVRTGNPLTNFYQTSPPQCAVSDYYNVPGAQSSGQPSDVLFQLQFQSLLDVGDHWVQCLIGYTRKDYCYAHSGFPCGYVCNTYYEQYTKYFTQYLNIHVYNEAPKANPTHSPLEPTWNSVVTLSSNASDMDQGSVSVNWTIMPPRGAPTRFTNEASFSLPLTSDRDIGTWRFQLNVVDDEAELKTFLHDFTVPNIRPTANPTYSPASPSWNSLVTMHANSADPDGGDRLHHWTISERPSFSTTQLSSSSEENPTLSLSSSKDIGKWKIRLDVQDNEQEWGGPFFLEFVVPNAIPQVAITGPRTVTVNKPIQLSVDPKNDPDGGDLSVTWNLRQSPERSSHRPGNNFANGPTLNQPTSSADVGRWVFDVDIKDDEDWTTTLQVTVDVVNIKPRIKMTGSKEIDIRDSIHLETTELKDEDGGDLAFAWDVVQAPKSANLGVPSKVASTAVLNRSTGYGDTGTWVFRLTVTDDEGESVEATQEVLVDGPVDATIDAPWYVRPDQFPLVLDGSASVDQDTPCPNTAGGCHVTDGRPAKVSLGIIKHEWSVTAVPPNQLGTYSTGPVSEVFGVCGTCPSFSLDWVDIPPGKWTFQLEVTDAEQNTDTVEHAVLVQEANSAPTLRLTPGSFPIRHTVTAQGLVRSDISIGAVAFDADNTYDGTEITNGLGITSYQWQMLRYDCAQGLGSCELMPDNGCSNPRSSNSNAITLYPVGSLVPPQCQGSWLVSLTVTDDDQPNPRSATVTTQLDIGNCDGIICIDSPTRARPHRIGPTYWDDEVTILYHIDSTLYDLPELYSGAYMPRVEIQPAGSNIPLVSIVDNQVMENGIFAALNRGSILGIGWPAYQADPPFPSTGWYDVRVSLLETYMESTVYSATERNAILAEAVKVTAKPTERYVRHVAMENGVQTKFYYEVSGVYDSLDSIRWNIRDASGRSVDNGELVRPPWQGNIYWNGRAGTVLQPPGEYTLEVTAMRSGRSLGTSDWERFALVGMDFDPVTTDRGIFGVLPKSVFVAGDSRPIVVSSSNFAELQPRMSPLRVNVQPAVVGGEVTLSIESGDPTAIEVFASSRTYSPPIALPKKWTAQDFTSNKLTHSFLVFGKHYGDVVLRLSYSVQGQIISEERACFRVGRFPGAVGIPIPGMLPFFQVLRTANEGGIITAALDPARHSERVGRSALLYLVTHKTPSEWAINPSLVDVTGGPKLVTISGASVTDNITAVWRSAKQGKYDLVYDFGNFAVAPAAFSGDGRLDPGDIIDMNNGNPSLQVEGSYTAPGLFPVRTAEYGMPGSSIQRTYVDGGWDGVMSGGFDFRLRGRVTYPTPSPRVSKLPLVVFVHGNHIPRVVRTRAFGTQTVDDDLTSNENFRGYSYLQDHLASHGYITLSVDLDEMVGSSRLGYPAASYPGIAIRSWITLKNIEKIITDSSVAGGEVYNLIDANRIYLVGHSRGGEAVIVALHQLKNISKKCQTTGICPPSGAITGFTANSIKGIVSLAPVTQAINAGYVSPQDVPYLLIYGSADGDVHGASLEAAPFRHYDRAKNNRFALRLEGGNHNHFNTSWGYSDAYQTWEFAGARDDYSKIDKVDLPGSVGEFSTLLSGSSQRAIATAYITAFLSTVDQGDRGALDYFLQPPARLRPSGIPATAPIHSQAQLISAFASTRVIIDDFETSGGAVVKAQISSCGMPVSTTTTDLIETSLQDRNLVDEAERHNRFFQDTDGALFSWSSPSEYVQTLPPAAQDLRGWEVLSFRVAQQVGSPPITPPPGPLSIKVELEDALGHKSGIMLDAVDTIPGIYWAEHPDLGTVTSAAFKTFRLPLDGFVANGNALDLQRVSKVRFVLGSPGTSSTGAIALDDLEVEQ